MINLTSTTLFDPTLFTDLVLQRLPSDTHTLNNLFSVLPPSQAVIKFKIVLCQMYLSDVLVGIEPSPSVSQNQAPLRPLPQRARKKQGDGTYSGDPSKPLSTTSTSMAPPIARKFQPPSPEALLDIVSQPSEGNPLVNAIKTELILGYGMFQETVRCNDHRQEWITLVRDGRLKQAVENYFGDSNTTQELQSMKPVLLTVMSTW